MCSADITYVDHEFSPVLSGQYRARDSPGIVTIGMSSRRYRPEEDGGDRLVPGTSTANLAPNKHAVTGRRPC
mgnify:FL=1